MLSVLAMTHIPSTPVFDGGLPRFGGRCGCRRTGKRTAALPMLDSVLGSHANSVGAYEMTDFIAACRERKVTAQVSQNESRRAGTAIDGRMTWRYRLPRSQTIHKRIKERFGWDKMVGRIRQTDFRGLEWVDQYFRLPMAASNLTRMALILFATQQGTPE